MLETSTAPTATLPDDSNLTDLALAVAQQTPEAPVYAVPNGTGGWLDVSYQAFFDRVRALAKGLAHHGVAPGDLVALMAPTSYEWALIDQAIWFAGAVSVPIYETSSPAQVRHILSDSGARLVFTGGEKQHRSVARALDETEGVDASAFTVFSMDDAALVRLADDGAHLADEVIEEARSTPVLDDTATLVYTSGTTGQPKGAKITHRNLAEGAVNILTFAQDIIGGGEQRTVMFLPLAHVLAHAVQYICLVGRIQIAHTSDLSRLTEHMASFHPTWLLLVPRLLEKVEAGILANARDSGKERIVTAARDTAIAYSRALEAEQRGEGKGPGAALKAKHALFNRLVYPKVRALMGGQARFAVSGASPLNPDLAHFFRGMGINIQEGYGLTESTAPATLNIPGHTRLGSVGLPVPGTTVKIAEDGEIWLRGIVICDGYLNRPEASAEAFSADGFFKTGDLGRLDDDGYLYVTGRKKELIVTAGGKNVVPTPLEESIRTAPLVSQVVVVGDDRPFIGALVALDPEAVDRWAAEHSRSPMSLAEAAEDEGIIAEVQRFVDLANEQVSRAESVRKFLILDRELTEASGHVTPSQKLQRHRVIEDHPEEIERLYQR
ncbi:AMP-dependent synthetase/ligase [Citricoccus sp. NR2]|uniref:AMP-dependent synthetase/ligase n=1 Tax=Citricoccus sp. NR2 TaxID=3004095 RepID=UPI0022DD368C|nr:long-chain fatty acid--CoA ligase [Citricoccus sp. NR2]WBL18976.1 long-chain fatty acid--CoA ligase [Citricoccus sp. NR2]